MAQRFITANLGLWKLSNYVKLRSHGHHDRYASIQATAIVHNLCVTLYCPDLQRDGPCQLTPKCHTLPRHDTVIPGQPIPVLFFIRGVFKSFANRYTENTQSIGI